MNIVLLAMAPFLLLAAGLLIYAVRELRDAKRHRERVDWASQMNMLFYLEEDDDESPYA